ncbi:PAS domain-containing protein, partial [Acinetobacter baumannii]|uniref:PAS domain-containing protein n=1 Tax=Acinetobacter baumannii TaxID=470 RepID=UPI0033930E23
MIVTDTDGRVTFLNPVAETLTGWASTDALGKPCRDVLKLLADKTREPVENPVTRALRERIMVAAQEP